MSLLSDFTRASIKTTSLSMHLFTFGTVLAFKHLAALRNSAGTTQNRLNFYHCELEYLFCPPDFRSDSWSVDWLLNWKGRRTSQLWSEGIVPNSGCIFCPPRLLCREWKVDICLGNLDKLTCSGPPIHFRLWEASDYSLRGREPFWSIYQLSQEEDHIY